MINAAALIEREAALSSHKSRDKPDSLKNYCKAKDECQHVLKDETNNCWHDYYDSLRDTTKLTSVWQTARAMDGTNGCSSLPTFTVDNNEYRTNTDKANILANNLAPYLLKKIALKIFESI